MKLNDFELEVYFGKYEFTAPYLLAQSDCEAMPVEELLNFVPGSKEGLLAQHLGYTEDHGDPELRELIARLYPGRKAEDTLVLSGAEEGIFILLNILLDAGDHAIVMYPNYPSAYEVIKAIPGSSYSEWRVKDDGQKWTIDLNELESLIRPETKLIAVNTPNNPTGYTFSDEELARLCEVCRERDIYLFCDEVYQGLERDGKRRMSAASLYDKAISLNVMSKAYGLAGLRIGWIVTADHELIEKMVKFRHYTSICNSAPSEYLAKVALKCGDALLARSKGIIAENLKAAEAFFDKFSNVFETRWPVAGPIAFHKLKLDMTIDEFCRKAVEKKGVLLLPGRVYGVNEPYFRMGYGRKSFIANLAKLEEFLTEEGYK